MDLVPTASLNTEKGPSSTRSTTLSKCIQQFVETQRTRYLIRKMAGFEERAVSATIDGVLYNNVFIELKGDGLLKIKSGRRLVYGVGFLSSSSAGVVLQLRNGPQCEVIPVLSYGQICIVFETSVDAQTFVDTASSIIRKIAEDENAQDSGESS